MSVSISIDGPLPAASREPIASALHTVLDSRRETGEVYLLVPFARHYWVMGLRLPRYERLALLHPPEQTPDAIAHRVQTWLAEFNA